MIDIAFADVSSAEVVDGGKRAVFVFTFYSCNFVGEYPRMAGNNSFFLVFFEINAVWHNISPLISRKEYITKRELWQ